MWNLSLNEPEFGCTDGRWTCEESRSKLNNHCIPTFPFLGYIQPQACPKFGGLLRNACSFHKWTPRAWPLEPRRKLEIVLVPQSEWYVQLCEDTGTTVGIIIVSFEEYDSTVLAVESKNLYSVIKKMVSPWCRWFPNPNRVSSFRRRASWWLTRQSPFPGSVQYAPTLMNIKF